MDIYNVASAADYAKVKQDRLYIHRAIRSMSIDSFELDNSDFGVAYAALPDGNAMITKWNQDAFSNGVIPLEDAQTLVNSMLAKYETMLADLMFMAKPD